METDLHLSQRSPDSSPATSRRKEKASSPYSREVKRLISTTAANYPNMASLQETLTIWQLLWEEMANEFGMPVFTAGVKKCCTFHKFFPVPAEVRAMCKEVLSEQVIERRSGQTKFIPCERQVYGGVNSEPGGAQCVGGLWVFWDTAVGRSGGDMYEKPVRTALRCECLQRWMVENGKDIHDPKDPLKNKPSEFTRGDAKAKAAGE